MPMIGPIQEELQEEISQWGDSGDEDSVLIEEGGASQCSTACPDDTCTVASLNRVNWDDERGVE